MNMVMVMIMVVVMVIGDDNCGSDGDDGGDGGNVYMKQKADNHHDYFFE